MSDPWDYAVLAEGVEAWGFRAMQEHGELLDREHAARLWLEQEYRPVVATLREADLIGDRHRCRGLHADRDRALPAVADARLERRRASARRPARSAPPIYPLTAPAVRPATMRFWKSSTSRMSGTEMTTEAAAMLPYGT